MPKSFERWRTRNTRVLSRKTTSKKIEKLKGKLRQAGSCSPPKASGDLVAARNVTSNRHYVLVLYKGFDIGSKIQDFLNRPNKLNVP